MPMNRASYSRYWKLPVLALLSLVALMLSNYLFKGFSWDVTENKLHTLSEGSLKITKAIDKPIKLKLYYSETAARELPQFRVYSQRVRELIEAFVAQSNGKIDFTVIDPEPYSEAQEAAAAAGLQSIAIGNTGVDFYFGLVASRGTENAVIMPFIEPDKEAFLEYDLAKLISSLDSKKRPVLAVLSSLLTGPSINPVTGQSSLGWVIDRKLSERYDLRRLPVNTTAIEKDVDVLMLIHPKALAEPTLYAIDQFVLRGGHVLIYVDPNAESDAVNSFGADGSIATSSSDLAPLFAAWGVAYDANRVVLDSRNALQVGDVNQVPQYHLEVLGMSKAYLNSADIVTANLEILNFSSVGALSLTEQSTLSLSALIQSSPSSQLADAEAVISAQNSPAVLQKNFKPSGEVFILAAKLTGNIKSAFEARSAPNQIMQSQKPAQIIIVADTDVLTDRLWVEQQSVLGTTVLNDVANNGDFAINLVDHLAGDPDLIALRTRTVSSRPFERMEKIQRSAERRYQDTQNQLQANLEALNQKIGQAEISNADANNVELAAKKKSEIAKLQKQKTSIRVQLRQVQRQLNQDIDNIVRNIKVINILMMPSLVALLAFLYAWRRRYRRANV